MLPGIWKKIVVFFLVSVSLLSVKAFASPSGGSYPPKFESVNGHYYDSWQIDRNSAWGKNGYIPNLMYESIGSAADLAFGWGVEFKRTIPNKNTRAGVILSFVQSWVAYGLDEDYVIMGGKPQAEWAWNGDEMAYMMRAAFNSQGTARGDCEDFTFLLGAIYLGAGFDVAIVNPPGHVALMIWLPEYPNANIYWDLGDGAGSGWIWVEGTGRRNPVGWTPTDFQRGSFDTHIFRSKSSELISVDEVAYSPPKPDPRTDVKITAFVNNTYKELNNMTLTYSLEPGYETKVTMNKISSTIYEGVIPRQKDGSDVEFYVQAFAGGGETVKSGKFSYHVENLILGVRATMFYLAALTIAILIVIYIVIRMAKRRLGQSQTSRRRSKYKS